MKANPACELDFTFCLPHYGAAEEMKGLQGELEDEMGGWRRAPLWWGGLFTDDWCPLSL